nr:hypothetical protein Iba_scaffold21020CG0010 [Ipomoea batatas]
MNLNRAELACWNLHNRGSYNMQNFFFCTRKINILSMYARSSSCLIKASYRACSKQKGSYYFKSTRQTAAFNNSSFS